jgi:hypothetical protein
MGLFFFSGIIAYGIRWVLKRNNRYRLKTRLNRLESWRSNGPATRKKINQLINSGLRTLHISPSKKRANSSKNQPGTQRDKEKKSSKT